MAADTVKIYYSNDPHIELSKAALLCTAACTVKFRHLSDVIKHLNEKNALDILMLSDIEEYIGKRPDDEVFILSNDTDYDEFISICRKHNINIDRNESIIAVIDPSFKKTVSALNEIHTDINNMPEPVKKQSYKTTLSQQNIDKACKRYNGSAWYNELRHILGTSKTQCEIWSRTEKMLKAHKCKKISKKMRNLMAYMMPSVKSLPYD